MTELTTTFKVVKKYKPKNLRGLVRDLALNGLSIKTKFPNAKTIFEKPRIQFLYIHHVFDDEINNFDKLLKLLSKHHSFISYSDAVNKILTGNIDKPYICISSDDGFKNNLAAVKIMEKYGAKGCFFVNPDTIGLKDFSKVKSFCNNRLNFPPTEFMDWNDLDKLIKSGHEIGSHTMGHINIAETNIKIVEDNINESYEILNKRIGKVLHFAYPYGRFFHFNKQAFDLVFKAGFTSCATAERGCHVAADRKLNTNELLIRRDHVICDWNINHALYFILNNSEKASYQTNLYPNHD
jgi:peptidoglycan/xylan/chitin deacetylase (PgdA/CDA1 family)